MNKKQVFFKRFELLENMRELIKRVHYFKKVALSDDCRDMIIFNEHNYDIFPIDVESLDRLMRQGCELVSLDAFGKKEVLANCRDNDEYQQRRRQAETANWEAAHNTATECAASKGIKGVSFPDGVIVQEIQCELNIHNGVVRESMPIHPIAKQFGIKIGIGYSLDAQGKLHTIYKVMTDEEVEKAYQAIGTFKVMDEASLRVCKPNGKTLYLSTKNLDERNTCIGILLEANYKPEE